MKKTISLVLSLLLVTVLAFSLASCDWGKDKSVYVSIDINPSIELTVDEDNVVVSAFAANEDANLLLYGEAGIVGAKLEDAVAKIIVLAIDLGYLGGDNRVVTTFVASEHKGHAEELQDDLNIRIVEAAEEKGVEVTVDETPSYSLERRYEALKEEHPDDALIQNLSIGKFKLALSAAESGEIELDAAARLDEKFLIQLVRSLHSQVETFETDDYKKVKTEIASLYDVLSGAVLDGVYAEYYMAHRSAHTATYWYGHMYQAYKTSSRAFTVMADVLLFAEKTKNYELSETCVDKIMTALDLEESERENLEAKNGRITLDSVYKYVDKRFKNTPVSESLAPMLEELDTALDDAEQYLEGQIRAEINSHREELEGAIDVPKGYIALIVAILPPEIKAMVNTQNLEYNSAVNDIIALFESGKAGQGKLRKAAKDMDALAESMLKRIEEDLSADELLEIDAAISDKQELIDEYKEEMEAAIEEAKDRIVEELVNEKNNKNQNKNNK